MKQITQNQYYQLVGLLTLSKRYNAKLNDIMAAAAEITGDEVNGGHTMDAVFNDYTADELLHKLDIEVSPTPPSV